AACFFFFFSLCLTWTAFIAPASWHDQIYGLVEVHLKRPVVSHMPFSLVPRLMVFGGTRFKRKYTFMGSLDS
ncbi:hypothetical protein B0T10DRAFT_468204, partial [Thelonectria olida]